VVTGQPNHSDYDRLAAVVGVTIDRSMRGLGVVLHIPPNYKKKKIKQKKNGFKVKVNKFKLFFNNWFFSKKF
jgi:hypothetical protein